MEVNKCNGHFSIVLLSKEVKSIKNFPKTLKIYFKMLNYLNLPYAL